jgi:hypothetical protein
MAPVPWCCPAPKIPTPAPQLHGPYRQWTRKETARTVTRVLGDGQAAGYVACEGAAAGTGAAARQQSGNMKVSHDFPRIRACPIKALARPAAKWALEVNRDSVARCLQIVFSW